MHLQAFPKAGDMSADTRVYDNVSFIASEIRKAKTTANITQRTPVKQILIKAPEKELQALKDVADDIENVGGIVPGALKFEVGEALEVTNIELDLSALSEN